MRRRGCQHTGMRIVDGLSLQPISVFLRMVREHAFFKHCVSNFPLGQFSECASIGKRQSKILALSVHVDTKEAI